MPVPGGGGATGQGVTASSAHLPSPPLLSCCWGASLLLGSGRPLSYGSQKHPWEGLPPADEAQGAGPELPPSCPGSPDILEVRGRVVGGGWPTGCAFPPTSLARRGEAARHVQQSLSSSRCGLTPASQQQSPSGEGPPRSHFKSEAPAGTGVPSAEPCPDGCVLRGSGGARRGWDASTSPTRPAPVRDAVPRGHGAVRGDDVMRWHR